MSLLPVQFGLCRDLEISRTPSYDWDNALHGPAGSCIFQYSYSGHGAYESRDEGRQAWPPRHAMLCQRSEPSRYWYPEEGTEAWSYGWLNFHGGDAIWKGLRGQYGSIVPLHPEGEALRRFHDLAERHEQRQLRDRLEASELTYRFLMALVRELETSPVLNPSPVGEAVRYLRHHHNRPLTVKELADRAGYTREHFTRLFREETGETPGAMLRRLRLETACLLLETQGLSVREVARQSGYTDPVHFHRAFAAAMGCPPLAYRRRKQRR